VEAGAVEAGAAVFVAALPALELAAGALVAGALFELDCAPQAVNRSAQAMQSAGVMKSLFSI
jgi:hypothetical protein